MHQRIVNSRTGETVADNAVLANNPLTRMRGLLGRKSLPAGEAIILRPASSIHTVFMLFAIDVIYLDRDDTVVKIVPRLAPFRFSAASGARSVIEMAAGGLSGVDLKVGDRLRIEAAETEGAVS